MMGRYRWNYWWRMRFAARPPIELTALGRRYVWELRTKTRWRRKQLRRAANG